MGFGGAAMRLMDKFSAPKTLSGGGSTTGMMTQVPVTFAADMIGSPSPVIGKALWVETPTGDQLRDLFPKTTATPNVSIARIVLDCEIVAGGRTSDCKVASETPRGGRLRRRGAEDVGIFRDVDVDPGRPADGAGGRSADPDPLRPAGRASDA